MTSKRSDGKERVVLGRKERSMTGFRWSGNEPDDLNDLELAEELGAVWDGKELVTYDMASLVWGLAHLSDDYMIDDDRAPACPWAGTAPWCAGSPRISRAAGRSGALERFHYAAASRPPSLPAVTGAFARASGAVRPLDQQALADALVLQARLTKPAGSLGRLEALGVRLAGISGECPPPVPSPAAVAVFAGDHGVVAQGVTPWPQEVTGQMVANFMAGGAAINVLARQSGARLVVVDVGVAADPGRWAELIESTGPAGPGDRTGLANSGPRLLHRRVRSGTGDLSTGPAMTEDEALAALDVGCDLAGELVAAGARCLITGEMGIGNTTPSAALIAAFTGRSSAEVTGRGTGIGDTMLLRKSEVIHAALALHADALAAGPLATLAAVGGLEIAALAGFIVGGAAAGVPVLVDGVVADAALLVAAALIPGVEDRCIAGHRSTEPGATAAMGHLGLEPLLDLGLRLGEGSGACLALPLVEAAARILAEMATFDSAGVTAKPS